MKKLLLYTAFLFLTQLSYGQWSKGKGNGFYKLSAWSLNTDQYYNAEGDITSNVARSQFNINLYAEYGISEKIDLIAYVPFFARTSQDDILTTTGTLASSGDIVSSVGDIDVGFNYSIYKKGNWAASIRLLLGLPVGEDNGGIDGSYQTGDGEFNQFLSGALGYSTQLKGVPFYAKSYIGFNNRTQDFSDEFRFGLESGINIFNKKVWLIGRLDIVQSLQNGSVNQPTIFPGSIFANNVSFIGVSAEANYYLTNTFGISAGFNGAVSGRNIAANPTVSGGIFLDIK